MEKVEIDNRCLACHSEDVDIISFGNEKSIICNSCCTISNQIKQDTDKLYDQNYYETNYIKIYAEQEEKSLKILNNLKEHFPKGSILDYGCGSGLFLNKALELGYVKNVGIDVSVSAIEYAKKNNSNIEFYNIIGDLGNNKFDILTFIDSVGHIEKIESTLDDLLLNHMKSNSAVIIRTPRINSAYIAYIKFLNKFLPKKYIKKLLFLPNRYLVFSENGWEQFIKKFNLEIVYKSKEKDYVKNSNTLSIKQILSDLILKRIPSILNNDDSMLYILRRKDNA